MVQSMVQRKLRELVRNARDFVASERCGCHGVVVCSRCEWLNDFASVESALIEADKLDVWRKPTMDAWNAKYRNSDQKWADSLMAYKPEEPKEDE